MSESSPSGQPDSRQSRVSDAGGEDLATAGVEQSGRGHDPSQAEPSSSDPEQSAADDIASVAAADEPTTSTSEQGGGPAPQAEAELADWRKVEARWAAAAQHVVTQLVAVVLLTLFVLEVIANVSLDDLAKAEFSFAWTIHMKDASTLVGGSLAFAAAIAIAVAVPSSAMNGGGLTVTDRYMRYRWTFIGARIAFTISGIALAAALTQLPGAQGSVLVALGICGCALSVATVVQAGTGTTDVPVSLLRLKRLQEQLVLLASRGIHPGLMGLRAAGGLVGGLLVLVLPVFVAILMFGIKWDKESDLWTHAETVYTAFLLAFGGALILLLPWLVADGSYWWGLRSQDGTGAKEGAACAWYWKVGYWLSALGTGILIALPWLLSSDAANDRPTSFWGILGWVAVLAWPTLLFWSTRLLRRRPGIYAAQAVADNLQMLVESLKKELGSQDASHETSSPTSSPDLRPQRHP